jgi:predicted NAD/FAD-dependent oxidoreductase
MAAFAELLPITLDCFRSEAGPISWAARNSAKPGRAGGEAWVIHASPARSRALIDRPGGEVAAILLADFLSATGCPPVTPLHSDAHRWLYALPQPPGSEGSGKGARFDAALGLGIAGDWLHSPRIEGAWLSGRALAEVVLAAS